MRLLAIESSCDETSAAIIEDSSVRSVVISSQIKIHAEYGGVVPELATREHLVNLQPVVRKALVQAGFAASELNAICATQGPGLPPALMIGWKAAQSMAFALKVPLIGVNHVEAHLYSPWFQGDPPRAYWEGFQPNISLVISGGHTLLAEVDHPLDHAIIGSTQDDAAGECFDKCAKLLRLGYPGGPIMDRIATQGNPEAYTFARPMLNQDNHDFSFSGLKTSVRYFLEKHPELVEDDVALPDLCASIQAAIVEVLVKKTIRVARRQRLGCITLSGGVACNTGLRKAFQQACEKHELNLQVAPLKLCTDNAAMVGLLGERYLQKEIPTTDWQADIRPSWRLTEPA